MARIGIVEGHYEGGLVIDVSTKLADIIFPRKDESLFQDVDLLGLKKSIKANRPFRVGNITVRNVNHDKVEFKLEDGGQKSEFWVFKRRILRYL